MSRSSAAIPVFLRADEIAETVRRLAREVAADMRGLDPVLVGVLRGSTIFLADLVRQLDFPLSIDFLAVSSYAGETSTGVVRILKDLDESITGRHVVLVEDIVDSGLTLEYLLGALGGRDPASLRVCVLLDKTGARKTRVRPDYVGFRFERGFVVGYGLDYRQGYRNLPYIGLLSPEGGDPEHP